MERWVPLFEIFLNSPSPEGEASIWFFQQNNSNNNHDQSKHPHPTSAFLSLLLSPVDIVLDQSPSLTPKRCVWFQTLPCTVQSRILSFLTIESHRFPVSLLRSIATQVLSSARKDLNGIEQQEEDFWVLFAARNLLDEIPRNGRSDFLGDRKCKIVVEGTEDEEEFDSMPKWLKNIAAKTRPILPWLPVSHRDLCRAQNVIMHLDNIELADDVVLMEEVVDLDESRLEVKIDPLILHPQIQEKAVALIDRLQSLDIPHDLSDISRDIQSLCVDAGEEMFVPTVLGLIEPWKIEDEMTMALLSHLLSGCSEISYSDWPYHVFSVVVLPKLLFLQCSASRLLLSCVTEFCKTHENGIMSVLLFPLLYQKGGINIPICDVLARVMKDCMNPSHIAAFCHRLLCVERTGSDYHLCLPCHRDMISNTLVWTEPLFSLFHQILSFNVPLTPDTIEKIVVVVEDVCCKFSKSLKFGTFLLSLVTKSEHALNYHQHSIMRVAKKTDTFVTKSIISKLSGS